MRLHTRGVELVVDLLDAAEHLDHMKPNEVKALLKETAMVLGELLKRDVPPDRQEPPTGLTA